MVHKVHERLGNSVDSPLEGVEEVSQVHRVLYLHGGGGGDDDHDDIYDNLIIMISIYGILYPLHQQMGGVHCQVGEGVVALVGSYFYYHHPGGYQETSIETYHEIFHGFAVLPSIISVREVINHVSFLRKDFN